MRFHIPYSVCKQIPKQSTSKQYTYRLFSSATTPKDSSVVKIHSALDLGCIDYSKSWAWQHVLLSRRLALRRSEQPPIIISEEDSDSDCILLLEHAPVYTLGRGSDENHLTFLKDEADEIRNKLSRKARGPGSARLSIDRQVDNAVIAELPMNQAVDRLCQLGGTPVIAPNNVPIYRVERGGEVTFHGPCQLVVYPLLDLRRPPYQQDLHWYLRMVEEVVIQTLQHYNIESVRDEENTGVWVGDDKIAAVGISSSRWITTHGFALNVNPDLSFFDTSVILPCGIEGKGVTSIAKVLSERRGEDPQAVVPTLQEVATVVVKTMENVFGVRLEHGEPLQ